MNINLFFLLYNFAHQSLFLDKVIFFIADTFPYIVVFFSGLFLIFYYKILSKNFLINFKNNWKEIFYVFFAVAISWSVAEIIKVSVHSPRPFMVLQNVHSLFSETGYAFPSQHATFFSALSVMIFFINKKVGYYFMFFAFLIGVARIMAGVHFPVDIIGGFLLGILTSVVFNYIVKAKK